jgi:hypothetical protein
VEFLIVRLIVIRARNSTINYSWNKVSTTYLIIIHYYLVVVILNNLSLIERI